MPVDDANDAIELDEQGILLVFERDGGGTE
jgi:hypothetical protein